MPNGRVPQTQGLYPSSIIDTKIIFVVLVLTLWDDICRHMERMDAHSETATWQLRVVHHKDGSHWQEQGFGIIGLDKQCPSGNHRRRFSMYYILLHSSMATLQPHPMRVLNRACAGARWEKCSTAVSRCSSSSSRSSRTTALRSGMLGCDAGSISRSFNWLKAHPIQRMIYHLQWINTLIIMFPYNGFDRFCACHGSFFAHECGHRT